MEKVKIGIRNIEDITLHLHGNDLRIDDYSNDGVIECSLQSLKKTIKLLENAYAKREDLSFTVFGASQRTIQMQYYQTSIGEHVFRGNYIIINHIPDIIKMLKSVKICKEKCVLDKLHLMGLNLDDLEELNATMRRRKKVLVDSEGNKYIEV
jgi:hypothetical protein